MAYAIIASATDTSASPTMPVVGGSTPYKPRRSPDAEIDDCGPAADQRRAVGPVTRLEPPAHRTDHDAAQGTADAAHDRRDPAAIEREPEQIARRQNQRDHAHGEEHPLADPLLG